MPVKKAFVVEASCLILLLLAVVILFKTSPTSGDFWWSDAPRHALDGAFYHDLFRDLPFTRIKQYAMDYYLQYPALTILFYPPLFPLVEAMFFDLFGVSQPTAQMTVAAFYLATAWGIYFFFRRWMKPASSFAVALLFIGLPEVAFWGRQVMLEIPAFAFLIWSACVLFAILDRAETAAPRSSWLYYVLALLLIGAVYTKQTVAFILPVYAWLLASRGRAALLRDRPFGAAAVFSAGLIPLAVIQLEYGHVNMNSVTGGQWTQHPITNWRSWLFYLEQMPTQAGWAVLVAALVYLLVRVFRKKRFDPLDVFLLLWLAWGYLFFSSIALKEPRHTLVLLLPLAFFAVAGVLQVLPSRAGPPAAVAFASLIFGFTAFGRPVPRVGGYREAVDYIAVHAPRNALIVFSGYRDGSFIFNMRARQDRPDLAILRADKLLLRVTQRRELGVQEKPIAEEEIGEMLNRYGVRYIVSQPNFWDDLQAMQRFQRVLHTGQFRRLAVIPVAANTRHDDHQLEIWENLGADMSGGQARKRIQVELPIAGIVVEGSIGARVSR
jgi:hypothetical protein